MSRAEPFVMAALAGLCAHPRVHDPEQVAKQAVEIGNAVARQMAAAECDSRPIGGQPTLAMMERAASWLHEHKIPDEGRAANLAEVFSLWAAEFYQKGQHDAGALVDGPPKQPAPHVLGATDAKASKGSKTHPPKG